MRLHPSKVAKLKARIQKSDVHSKTRTSFVYAVTSHVKFQSPMIKKLKIQGDNSFKKKFSFCQRFFPNMFIFWE